MLSASVAVQGCRGLGKRPAKQGGRERPVWIAFRDTGAERGPCSLPLHLEGETETRGRAMTARGLPGMGTRVRAKAKRRWISPGPHQHSTLRGLETGWSKHGDVTVEPIDQLGLRFHPQAPSWPGYGIHSKSKDMGVQSTPTQLSTE